MAYYDILPTPLGDVFIGGSAQGIHRVEFIDGDRNEAYYAALLALDAAEPAIPAPRLAREAVEALRNYFEARAFTFDMHLTPRGTLFQRMVWHALLDVAPGETVSYGDIARAIGQPTASRAVGQAVGHNPIAVVVPCHRIVGSSGALTGYASGLDRKRWLLAHESAAHQRDRPRPC